MYRSSVKQSKSVRFASHTQTYIVPTTPEDRFSRQSIQVEQQILRYYDSTYTHQQGATVESLNEAMRVKPQKRKVVYQPQNINPPTSISNPEHQQLSS